MAKVVWQLTHYPKNTSTGWGSGTIIDKYSDLQLNVAIGSSKDRFNFKIDIDNEYSINTNDKIKFSRRYDNEVHGVDDVVMLGVIRTVDPTLANNRQELVVSGYNFSEGVTSGLIFIDATNLTISEMFQEAISNLKLSDDNYTVEWDGNNTKKDGSAFPLVGEKIFYKSFSDTLDKFSNSEYTEDGNYYWYVDEDNKLRWRPNSDSESGLFNQSTSSYVSLKTTRDVNDVKNYVIVKGGYGPNNKILQEKVSDYTSISRHGFKYYILTDGVKVVENAYQQDLQDQGLATTASMEDASYPLTTYWSGGSSFSSFSDYATAFNQYARAELKSLGKSFIDNNKFGKLKVDVSMKPFDHSYKIGNLVTATITTNNFGTRPLRVESINMTSTNDGISFTEDIGSI